MKKSVLVICEVAYGDGTCYHFQCIAKTDSLSEGVKYAESLLAEMSFPADEIITCTATFLGELK